MSENVILLLEKEGEIHCEAKEAGESLPQNSKNPKSVPKHLARVLKQYPGESKINEQREAQDR
ncbi:MAG: hypothetical protein QW747_06680 [Ignisphaera sp.]